MKEYLMFTLVQRSVFIFYFQKHISVHPNSQLTSNYIELSGFGTIVPMGMGTPCLLFYVCICNILLNTMMTIFVRLLHPYFASLFISRIEKMKYT